MKLIKKLYKTKLLSFSALYALIVSVKNQGMNLMTLLDFSARMFPENKALKYGNRQFTYSELLKKSYDLSLIFENKHQIKEGHKVGILCRNDDFAVRSIFALSALGANIYFINADMGEFQLYEMIEDLKLDFVIHGRAEITSILISGTTFIFQKHIENRISFNNKTKRKGLSKADIVVLTGGTTGKQKSTKRKASIKDYLNPFFALLTQLDLDEFKSIFIAPPIYHGFGLSSLIIAFLLGAKVYLSDKFETKKSLEIIEENNIEVVCLVPLMLQRMLHQDSSKLTSLKKIISGGAPLSPVLVNETIEKCGDVLYNLYGTSEAGFSVMANPEILKKHASSIGKAIRGVNLKILNENDEVLEKNKIGRICIKTSWSMNNKTSKWVDTGDLGYLDENGLLFLSGRADEMIVSGGENVYPLVLENVLNNNNNIKEVAVVGIDDEEFGQRLKAFIVLKEKNITTEKDIFNWLKGRVARFETPSKIEFVDNLPYTNLGKLDKKNVN